MTTSKPPYISKTPTPSLPLTPKELSTGSRALQPGEPVENSLSQKFRQPYGQPRQRLSITFAENGKTKQSFAAECDINTIMARYLKTGLLEHVKQVQGQYLDVTGADFAEAQNFVAGAKSMFHMLPSHIRTKFENSSEKFFEFMENPANAQEATALGLQTVPEETSTPPTLAPATSQPVPLEGDGKGALRAEVTPAPSTPAKAG